MKRVAVTITMYMKEEEFEQLKKQDEKSVSHLVGWLGDHILWMTPNSEYEDERSWVEVVKVDITEE